MGDLQTFSDEDGKRGEQSGIVTMFDIWCPVVESALLFPMPPYDDLEWAIAPIVFTALLPSIFGRSACRNGRTSTPRWRSGLVTTRPPTAWETGGGI